MAIQRVEVVTGREARRQYTEVEKLRLVEDAFAPGVKTAPSTPGVPAWTKACSTAGGASSSVNELGCRPSRRWR